MSELYLIAHVVRSQPAFDIAEQIQIGDEQGWIIPTSGHRAYPYWTEKLYSVNMGGDSGLEEVLQEFPADLPDHYSLSAAPKGQGLIKNLAERLGFVPKPPTISRR